MRGSTSEWYCFPFTVMVIAHLFAIELPPSDVVVEILLSYYFSTWKMGRKITPSVSEYAQEFQRQVALRDVRKEYDDDELKRSTHQASMSIVTSREPIRRLCIPLAPIQYNRL